jgi:signal transduction histidine kinase
MAFALCVSAFIEIIVAENVGQLLLRTGVFLFVLLISIQFVKNIFMLEHLRDKLEDANERLKDLDKLKSEFVSLASHQLRSPLTVIKGYASLLVDDNLPEKQTEMVRHIYLSAQGMANVVEDFLNVTKIEQGGMKYIFAPVDIRTIVNDLVSDMKISAEDKHLEFLSEIDTQETFMVNADGTKIKQVFLNLVDNSIKYTKEGFVKVSLKKQKIESGQDCILFLVSDSGIGITEEVKSKLFQKFNRGNGAALNTGGSGLGLYLAQEIIKAHKGEILIESEGLGKGSTFSVILPIL